MTAKIVTDETFEADVLSGPRPVIVEYWAQWCGPCHQVSPVLEAIAAEHADKAELIKLLYFAGLSVQEAANALGLSKTTAQRHATFARAWLFDAMERKGS